VDTTGAADAHYKCCRRTLQVLQMDTTGATHIWTLQVLQMLNTGTARNAKGAAD